jgi:hypothetical protein
MKRIALAILFALGFASLLPLRRTPIGFGYLVPNAVAQVNPSTCPSGTGPIASLKFSLDSGASTTWGCFDSKTGNLMVGSKAYVAPPSANSDLGAQINAALATHHNTIDARGILSTQTLSTTITVTAPANLYLPCARITFNTQVLAVEADDVHIHTCGNGAAGAASPNGIAQTQSATQFVAASSLTSTVNAIMVQRPPSQRTNGVRARISGFTLEPLYINMNGVGNRAISTTSCVGCVIDHPVIDNANCSDGALYIEADLASPNHSAISYLFRIDTPIINIANGNTRCHALFLNASNGEMSQFHVNNLQATGCGTCPAGAGSDQVYVLTGPKGMDTFDSAIFENSNVQNAAGASTYGWKFVATGNFLGQTGGRIGTVLLVAPHVERIGQKTGGVAIGCVNASGEPDGTGCGAITLISPSANNFTTGIDYAHLGAEAVTLSDQTTPASGSLVLSSHINQVASGNFSGTCTFASSTSCSITYSTAFNRTPTVFLQPVNPGSVVFALARSSRTGFTIAAGAPNSVTVNWQALGNPN